MSRFIIIRVCLCLFGSIIIKPLFSQTITVKSVSLQPSDQTAIEQPCFDLNGDTCALLKIKTDNLEGMEFPNTNQYIKKDYSAGIYHIYVPALSKKLDLLHKDYMPVQIDMSNYGYKKLRKGGTYFIVLDAPKKADLKSSVIIKVEPKQAQIVFDGHTYDSNQNGTFEFPVSAGNHIYEVFAPDYHSQNGTITIGKSEAKAVSVRLQPITHEVVVNSNVVTARVFVDNTEWGGVGKLLIPQGEHTIRVQADGYVDMTQSVTINASTAPLSFQLKENKRTTHIHPTPVTIYSKSSCVYKNYKEIIGWTNGATIMFMPGEYMLTAYGNEKEVKKEVKIVVGKDSLKVDLDSGKWGLSNMNIEEDVAPTTKPSSANSLSSEQGENRAGIRNYSTSVTNSSRSNYYNRTTTPTNYNRSVGNNFNRNSSSSNNTVTRSTVNSNTNSRNANRNSTNSNSSSGTRSVTTRSSYGSTTGTRNHNRIGVKHR